MSANLFDVSGWTLGDLASHESLKTPESRKSKKIKNKIKIRKQINEKGPISKIDNTKVKPIKKSSFVQQKMLKNLSKGKFRWINEKLYTSSSSSALELFQKNPLMFDEYHQGFCSAVRSWPVNPVDIFINYLKGKPKEWVVADLGCGEGKIAHESPNKVLSFDLVAKNSMIIACDIAKLPIPNYLFDIAIFCLSLMGTNYVDFLKEAHRTLKPKGELKIAEVVSRFSDIDSFIEVLAEIGFQFVKKDNTNKMFVILDFVKSKPKIIKPNQILARLGFGTRVASETLGE
ncbi:8569_t:CDS:2 [Cetraspora pellucida]|uniref:Ribosomal RNA-processing protein 8 n=1 Tax=Cetraspora pellucida TaxID=1433469 RepID=A0A9N9I832_9GLOM|nr:8569_t:CDS:2 [Cetraspora pellucida]